MNPDSRLTDTPAQRGAHDPFVLAVYAETRVTGRNQTGNASVGQGVHHNIHTIQECH